MSPRFGRNSQPSNNGTTGFHPSTQPEMEEALHFARKHEQRVWGSGDEHEKAHAEVERLEKLLPEKALVSPLVSASKNVASNQDLLAAFAPPGTTHTPGPWKVETDSF